MTLFLTGLAIGAILGAVGMVLVYANFPERLPK
jgi:hypothetical protein